MRRVGRGLLAVDAFRLALGVGLAFAALQLLNGVFLGERFELPVVGRVEHAAQDWALTRLRGPRPPSGRVVVVAIDERSLAAEGRWPWSRAKMARLVDRLAEGGAAAVGLDVLWSEEDEVGRRLARVAALVRAAREGAGGGEAARRLDEAFAAARGPDAGLAVDVDPTALLADAIERARNVTVGFAFLDAADAGAPQAARAEKLRFFRTAPLHLPDGGRLVPAGGAPAPLAAFPGVVPPVDAILEVADSGGHLVAPPDRDGVLRRYRAIAAAGDALFPALGVAVLARALGEGGAPAAVVPVGARGAPEALQAVRVGGAAFDVDELGRVPLNWYGRARDFPTWSAADVLHGRVPRADLAGRIALVGATAAGTFDQRVTPFDAVAPGVVAHATFVENALRGELLERSGATLLAELAALAAVTVLLARAFARARPPLAVGALALGVAAWVGGAALALSRWNVVLALGLPVAQMAAMFGVATSHRFFAEEREKRRARETFGRFLAPAVVEEVLREGTVRLGGEKRVLTVLFADVRGFTALSERLDPRALIELLNEYLAPMTEIVVSGHEGTLDKYMGDAIMAFWGAPRPQPDHALRACRAALAMTGRLAALREGWRARGLPEVDVGIGVNTGPMSVGFVGSEDRFYNYTVLGDAVNLASRLEGANREYGTRVILGPETRAAAGEAVVARELDRVRVKGRREPVRIFELLALAPAPPALAAFAERFAGGLSAYQAQRWDEAAARFREADALRGGDPASRLYLERCEAMRRAPPGPGWDGVFEMKAK